jgi:hypothetical protein
MANLSLYISGQTEENDVAEFFQKNLMSAGENPIAFFDGVFYESHQERVGNIAFQDYLIYSDKAVYLWARGTTKDYLDRFELGSVSVNSRNKDYDFATVNLKVRREGKEPVYVIFDMVELREADLIVRLHTVIESVIEQYMGLNYRATLPDNVADIVLEEARSVCIPQSITLRLDAPNSSQQQASIGYGQDLLEQYKASIGYGGNERQPQPQQQSYQRPQPQPQQQSGYNPVPAAPGGAQYPEGFSPTDVFKKIEGMLPGADPGALKKVADSIKDMLGEVPMKLRDQFVSDMQHVPGMLSALNELLTNISDNPQAERFVMNIVKTAVRNDGMIGSVGKLIKLSSNFGSSGKKKPAPRSSQRPASSASAASVPQKERDDSFDDFDSPVRKKKIQIKNDASVPGRDFFSDDLMADLPDSGSFAPEKSRPLVEDIDDSAVPKRKKISVKAPEADISPLIKDMMSMDDPDSGTSAPEPAANEKPAVMPMENGQTQVATRKIRIVPEAPPAELPELEISEEEILQAMVSDIDVPELQSFEFEDTKVDFPEVEASDMEEPEPMVTDTQKAETLKTEVRPSESGAAEKPEVQIQTAPVMQTKKSDFTGNSSQRKKFNAPGKHGRR